MSFTQLAEVRTFFTDEGAGDPPALFVHGWTCNSLDWHWLHQVRPDEFNALVLSWIAGLPVR